jgi:hypothetical protein
MDPRGPALRCRAPGGAGVWRLTATVPPGRPPCRRPGAAGVWLWTGAMTTRDRPLRRDSHRRGRTACAPGRAVKRRGCRCAAVDGDCPAWSTAVRSPAVAGVRRWTATVPRGRPPCGRSGVAGVGATLAAVRRDGTVAAAGASRTGRGDPPVSRVAGQLPTRAHHVPGTGDVPGPGDPSVSRVAGQSPSRAHHPRARPAPRGAEVDRPLAAL